MRIVFLAHRVPYPPNKGDKIRAFHELRGLAEHGHDVHLLAFADDPDDLGHGAALARLCASVVVVPLRRSAALMKAALAGVRGAPLSLGFFGAAAMHHHVAEVLRREAPYVIVAYSSAMAQFVPAALSGQAIVDLVDADSEKWREYAQRVRAPRSWLYQLEYRRLRTYEQSVIDRFAQSIVTTEREARLLDPEGTRMRRLRTFEGGVDLAYFTPPADAGALEASSHRRIVFTGTMDYSPNIEAVTYFAEHVLPRVRAADPTAEFVIAGNKPTARVRRLRNDWWCNGHRVRARYPALLGSGHRVRGAAADCAGSAEQDF